MGTEVRVWEGLQWVRGDLMFLPGDNMAYTGLQLPQPTDYKEVG